MDLHSSVDDLAKLMKGRDAVYFTAGSRGKDLLQTDAYGAVKTMQAAKKQHWCLLGRSYPWWYYFNSRRSIRSS